MMDIAVLDGEELVCESQEVDARALANTSFESTGVF